jgi:GT2 family glycosyltransferase
MNVSVIIAAGYNRPWRLRALLGLLAKQTRKPHEVIIADDTGLPETPFGDLGATTVVRSGLPPDVNGVSVARNAAAYVATGDVLLLLDDDSLPNAYCVEVHQYVHGLQNGKPAAVLGQRTPEYRVLHMRPPIEPLSDKARHEVTGALTWGNFISNNLSLTRDAFLALHGFDESFAVAGEYGWEDIELGIRWFGAGYGFGYSPDAAVYHAENPRTPEKQAAADRAYYRLVRKWPAVTLKRQ